MADLPTDPESGGPGVVRGAGSASAVLVGLVVIGSVQVLGLLAYCVAIAVSTRQEGPTGATTSSFPAVEIAIYLLFAVGLGFVVRGLLLRARWARTPFLVTQMFGVIIGYTLWSGDGGGVRAVGALVGLVSLVAGLLVLRPSVGELLD